MELDELDELADDPKMIEGIYNYCDRWCERCPFTDRCLTFAMEEETREKRARGVDENVAFWNELHETFQGTVALLRQMAEQMGIDLNSVPGDLRKSRRRTDVAQTHPLTRDSEQYIKKVDFWFMQAQPLFDEKQKSLEALVRMNVPGINVEGEVRELNDAVEVIRWYQYFIQAKLQRSVRAHINDADEMELVRTSRAKDADGSTKTALIAIDRSIGAWGRMLSIFPERETETLEILVHLDRLRRAVAQEFPNARMFVRPGFDTISLLEE